MTKKTTAKPVVTRRRGGGVYVDGKRVEWTKPAENNAHVKRIAEREARKAAPIVKEMDDG